MSLLAMNQNKRIFESKQAISITLFARRPNIKILEKENLLMNEWMGHL